MISQNLLGLEDVSKAVQLEDAPCLRESQKIGQELCPVCVAMEHRCYVGINEAMSQKIEIRHNEFLEVFACKEYR